MRTGWVAVGIPSNPVLTRPTMAAMDDEQALIQIAERALADAEEAFRLDPSPANERKVWRAWSALRRAREHRPAKHVGSSAVGWPRVLPERIQGAEGLLLRRWAVDDAEGLGQAVAESLEHLRPWMSW